ncbi:MAG: peroxiredoxin [bacterium]
MSGLKVGSKAPDFSLPGTGGKVYSLDQFDHGLILAFYPGDFTPVCTKQFCSYRDDGDRLESLGVPLLGISPQSVDSHERFSRENALTTPLASDPDKEVAKAYGALGPGGFIRRAVFVIDGSGVIRYRHVPLFGLTYHDVDDLEKAVATLA